MVTISTAPDQNALSLARHGAELNSGGASEHILAAIENAVGGLPIDRAGIRIHANPALDRLLDAEGPVGSIAVKAIGARAKAVRAILFDKHAEANWSLAWHQDRTIVVRNRIDVPHYGPWTVKAGLQHVAPEFSLLERMVTARLHLDPVTSDNAPLLVAPGSHRLGRIPESEIQAAVARCGQIACLAERGDVWLYSTPILHASMPSRSTERRRVLQVDYSAEDLPGGLEWLGIG